MSWKDQFPKEDRYFETDSGILYLGDCLEIMKGFPKDIINLVYVDPPYGIDRDKVFGMPKWKSVEEHYKFCDKLGLSILRKIDSKKRSNYGIAHYLSWMYPRLILMKKLLAENGSIYVHLDWHMVHYVKILMDEIFGYGNFRNEIVWCYAGGGSSPKNFADKHDTIMFYINGSNWVFNVQRIPYGSMGLGKTWRRADGSKPHPEGKHLEDWWTDIKPVLSLTDKLHRIGEWINFQTQKPEALLKRIILASSNSNHLVADFFCGSGTALAVAEKLGRRWIGCDVWEEACAVSKMRLEKLYQERKKGLGLLRRARGGRSQR